MIILIFAKKKNTNCANVFAFGNSLQPRPVEIHKCKRHRPDLIPTKSVLCLLVFSESKKLRCDTLFTHTRIKITYFGNYYYFIMLTTWICQLDWTNNFEVDQRYQK